MTLGKIIDKLLEFYNLANTSYNDHVKKPFSWALYQTWKWCDGREKERE